MSKDTLRIINNLIEGFNVEIFENEAASCTLDCLFWNQCTNRFKRVHNTEIYKACDRIRKECATGLPYFFRSKDPKTSTKPDAVAAALEAAIDMVTIHE